MDMTTFCSTDITELAKAMLKVQADLLPALKDRKNTFSRLRYATLNSVMETGPHCLNDEPDAIYMEKMLGA